MGTDISFGRLLRMRRRALDLTQEALARQVGYSVITIRKVESDERRPSRQLVERLANSLRIAPEQRAAFTALGRILAQSVRQRSRRRYARIAGERTGRGCG